VPALVALFAVIMATPAGGHEQVTVRAGIHAGFGRLAFEWPAPVEIDGRQEGSRYQLSFGRPLAVALDPSVARLGAYLRSAHLGPDRRELAFELAPGIAVRQAVEHGRIVVLDLAPDSTARQATPAGRIVVSDLPPVASAEQVKVRAGLHDGFGRAVFEWSVPTTFEAVTAAGRVDIRFSRAGDLDHALLAARLGAWLEGASATRSDGGSNMRFELQPGVSARVFQVDGHRIAVDLTAEATQPAQPNAAVEARPPPAPSAQDGAAPAAQPGAPKPALAVPAAAARTSIVSAATPPAPATDQVQPSDPTGAAEGPTTVRRWNSAGPGQSPPRCSCAPGTCGSCLPPRRIGRKTSRCRRRCPIISARASGLRRAAAPRFDLPCAGPWPPLRGATTERGGCA
jgi:hypothetical protein